jgi:hypothetical protein
LHGLYFPIIFEKFGRARKSKELEKMNLRQHPPMILSSLLLFALLAACAQSSTGTHSGNTSNPSVATSHPGGASTGGGCNNAFFPTSVGTTWSYSSSGSSLGAYAYTWTVTDLSNQGFTTSDQYSTGVNATVKWTCQNGNLAALNGGSNSLSLKSSNVTMKSNSVNAVGFNIPADFSAGNSWSEKVTVDGTATSSDAKTIDTEMVTQLNCQVAGFDTTSVPAGKFDTVRTICTQTVSLSAIMQGTAVPAGTPAALSITNWYAKGIGLVQSIRSGASLGMETIVLTQYSLK